MTETFSQQEVEQFDAELSTLMDELGIDDIDAEFDEASVAADQEMDALAQETGIASAGQDAQSVAPLAEDAFEEQFLRRMAEKRARKIASWVYRMAKRYARKCRHCNSKVTKTLRLVRSRRWVAAAISGARAAHCIRKCMRS
jgi:hypothetical protein